MELRQCDEVFVFQSAFRGHRVGCHTDNLPNLPDTCLFFNAECEDCIIEPMETAVNGVYRSVTIATNERCITADQLLRKTAEGIRHVLKHCFAHGENVKVFTST